MSETYERCNYYFSKDGKAYTQDKVLVYNLFTYDVPPNVTPKDVQDYFSKFGKVANVHLLEQQRTGFVNFSDPLAAAEALRNQMYEPFRCGKYNVTACHSWHQPSTTEGKTANVAIEATTLLYLNDDCLVHIWRHLEFSDKIYFAMTHSRLAAVAKMCSKQEYKDFHLEKLDSLTLWQQRELFRIFGSYMETVTGIRPFRISDWIDGFMCGWTNNVKVVNLKLYTMPHTTLSKLLQRLSQITELRLHECGLRDDDVLAISYLPNLVVLSLAQNYELTGKHLDYLTVQHLDLYACYKAQATFVRDTLRALTQLVSLNLKYCSDITTAVLQDIIFAFSRIESLKISISNNYEFNYVGQLPSLKHLEIVTVVCSWAKHQCIFNSLLEKAEQLEYMKLTGIVVGQAEAVLLATFTQLRHLTCSNNGKLNDACLREFAKLKYLEELDVSYCNANDSDCDAITADGVLHVLGKCTKLKKLNLRGSLKITQSFIKQAIDVLRAALADRDALLLMYVDKTRITSSIEEDVKYIEASSTNLLKLNCEQPAKRYYEHLENFADYNYDCYYDDGRFTSGSIHNFA